MRCFRRSRRRSRVARIWSSSSDSSPPLGLRSGKTGRGGGAGTRVGVGGGGLHLCFHARLFEGRVAVKPARIQRDEMIVRRATFFVLKVTTTIRGRVGVGVRSVNSCNTTQAIRSRGPRASPRRRQTYIEHQTRHAGTCACLKLRTRAQNQPPPLPHPPARLSDNTHHGTDRASRVIYKVHGGYAAFCLHERKSFTHLVAVVGRRPWSCR